MTGAQLFWVAWDFEPTVIIGCAALLLAYLWVVRFRINAKTAFFAGGVVLMLLTLTGPLDFLGDNYLFSAHMLEHILLELAVPPLLLLGLPEEPVQWLLSFKFPAGAERLLSRPPVALPLAVGTLWLWHLPVLYNAALASDWVHAMQHLSMLITGTIFFWPIFTPLQAHRIPPLYAAVYIFAAMAADMLLGILLTFSPRGYYPMYMRQSNGAGIFHLIRTGWKLTPQEDLNLGGMFMWIIGGLLYFSTLLVAISRLYQGKNPEEAAVADNAPGKPGTWNSPKPEFIPSPTYWPFVLSLGAALMGLGALTSKVIGLAGIILFIAAAVQWAASK